MNNTLSKFILNRRSISGFFLTILLILMAQPTQSLQATYSYIFDFEDNLDGWFPNKITYNTEFTIDHQVQEAYTSSKSAKLIGTSTYCLNFSAQNITIELTNSSTIDFALVV